MVLLPRNAVETATQGIITIIVQTEVWTHYMFQLTDHLRDKILETVALEWNCNVRTNVVSTRL